MRSLDDFVIEAIPSSDPELLEIGFRDLHFSGEKVVRRAGIIV
jgi:hypothetical protein